MKMKRTSIGIGLVLAGALTAVAWNSQEQDIYKLGVDNIYNPAGTTVTVNDSLTVNGTLTASTITGSGGLTIISGAYTGVLNIVSTTLMLVVNGTVTNVLDADITSE